MRRAFLAPFLLLTAFPPTAAGQDEEEFVGVQYDDVDDMTIVSFQLSSLKVREGQPFEPLNLEVVIAGPGKEPSVYGPVLLLFTRRGDRIKYGEIDAVSVLADGKRESFTASSVIDDASLPAATFRPNVSRRGFLETVVAEMDGRTAEMIGGARETVIRVGSTDFELTGPQKAMLRLAGSIQQDPARLAAFRARVPKLKEVAESYSAEWNRAQSAARRKSANVARAYREQRHAEIVQRVCEEFGIAEDELEWAVGVFFPKPIRIVP